MVFSTKKENRYQSETLDFFKTLSPVAWQHINLFGWYDFSEEVPLIDVENFIEKLGDKII